MAHLTPRQKYAIQVLRGEKCSQKEIAQKIGKDKTVISRELRRNIAPESRTFFAYSKGLPDTDNYTRFLNYKMPFLPLEYHGNSINTNFVRTSKCRYGGLL